VQTPTRSAKSSTRNVKSLTRRGEFSARNLKIWIFPEQNPELALKSSKLAIGASAL
jgi:hypothetical protein